jgi:tRNA pseudouridine55 synthase
MFQNFHLGEILLVDKPLTWTSHDLVNKIKYASKAKIGHAGTLDPLATGLMIVCTGKYTKKLTELTGFDKTYEGIIYLGGTTATYDSEMPVEETFDISNITELEIMATAKKFIGTIQQMPPIFSAIKVGGKKSYEAARKGETVTLQPRTITIKQFEITKIALPEIYFTVSCSKGTYIRSLAFDFGRALNNGAYLKSLKRTAIGEYQLKDAWPLEELINHIKQHPELSIKPNL